MSRLNVRIAAPRLAAWGATLALLAVGQADRAHGAELFDSLEVNQAAFVVVAAPIGASGTKAQLQIYEQVKAGKRPCFAVNGAAPGVVSPLLGTFDFTGICSRYIDSVGYSTRIGNQDLFRTYRLVVRKTSTDNLLVAMAGPNDPEMVVARTLGLGGPTEFLEFKFEPGWRLRRRAYGQRALGHVYLYRDSWPDSARAQAPAPRPVTQPGAPTLTQSVSAPVAPPPAPRPGVSSSTKRP